MTKRIPISNNNAHTALERLSRLAAGLDQVGKRGGPTFYAKVLSTPIPRSPSDASVLVGGTQPSDNMNTTVITTFKGRIVGPRFLHRFLDDPCDAAFSDRPEFVKRLISKHTEFTAETGVQDIPNEGDIVKVLLHPTGAEEKTWNLQTGVYVGMHMPALDGDIPTPRNCKSPFAIFRRNQQNATIAPRGGATTTVPCKLDEHRSAADLASTYNLDDDQAKAIVDAAAKIGKAFDPGWLTNILAAEGGKTDKSFDTKQFNKKCAERYPLHEDQLKHCALGIIQFMPATTKSLGKQPSELYDMSFEKQLNLTVRYFQRYGPSEGPTSQGDAMMTVFLPAAVGMDDSTNLADLYARTKNCKGKSPCRGPGERSYYEHYNNYIGDNPGIITRADYINLVVSHSELDPPC